MARVALVSGSFDPITNGHADVLAQALDLFDAVVVAVAVSATKPGLFDFDARVEMIREAVGERVRVVRAEGLIVDMAAKVGACAIVRGLRDGADFDYEMQMAGMNGHLAPGIRTVFVPASPATRHISATLVRQVAQLGGDVSGFVPAGVARRLAAKFGG
jgi:pantetheine-phosphate adenylyltransferase